MNIGIIGVGGTGGYFGGKLALLANTQAYTDKETSPHVYFLARGAHLDAIRTDGLTVQTENGTFCCRPQAVSDNPKDFPKMDLVLICVKSYDLADTLASIKNIVDKHTIVLPLLNGMDIYDRVKAALPQAVVLPACAYIGAYLEKPGVVIQNGGACSIYFGKDPARHCSIQEVEALLSNAHINYFYTENIQTEIFSKYLFIASYGLITADSGKTLGQVLESPALVEELSAVMTEIENLASAKGVSLPKRIVADSVAKAKGFAYETKTSFQRDFELTQKKDERDLFGSALITKAAALGLKTPTTQRLYASLIEKKPWPEHD